MNEKQTFFLSTPIYYVNSHPHLGHAYTSTVADVFTRFQRLMGLDSFLLTGTDEHGDKIVQAAEKNGLSPQELADRVSAEFKNLLPRLEVRYNRFIRTTDPEHKAIVQKFMQKVYDNGDIYFGEYAGHYCYGCERFYTEKELENGLCPQHRTEPVYISEKNYFFRMSRYQDWLKGHILEHPDFIRPERYRSEVLALLDSGALEDLCISRPKSRLQWGIELPFDKDFVCYVWFDALVNYVSALNWPDGDDFRRYWPNARHLIAKDILKPHAVFWPTMLRAAGLEPYRGLNVHGYWLARETKMSKSQGNVVDPLAVIETHGLDAFRYFVLREMRFGSDADFSEEALIARLNSDLANDLGNLFSRVLSMASRYFGGKVPAPENFGAEEKILQDLAGQSLRNYQDLFRNFNFSAALEALWELVRALNKYVDQTAPWALFKENKIAELSTVIYTLLEFQRKIALHLLPVMPGSAARMLEQLGQKGDPAALEAVNLQAEAESFGGLEPGTALASSSNLFPRLDAGQGKSDKKKGK
jgi:methionyl-tRNA synthetase